MLPASLPPLGQAAHVREQQSEAVSAKISPSLPLHAQHSPPIPAAAGAITVSSVSGYPRDPGGGAPELCWSVGKGCSTERRGREKSYLVQGRSL